MSIHHDVTIHCDSCGHWEHADGESAARRRRRGWRVWLDDGGHWQHTCPKCTAEQPGGGRTTKLRSGRCEVCGYEIVRLGSTRWQHARSDLDTHQAVPR